MLKNVASKVIIWAWDTANNTYKTGDAANITCYVSKDGAAPVALTDTSASELDSTNMKGAYVFDITASESNGDDLYFGGKSVTANIIILPTRFRTDDLFRYGIVDYGTGVSAAATTAKLRAGCPILDGVRGLTLLITTGTGALQAAQFNDYDAATQVATVDSWATIPASFTYIVFATPAASSLGVTVDAASVRTAIGMAGANFDTQVAGVQAGVSNIQTRIPPVLVGDKMDSNLSAVLGTTQIGTGLTGDNYRPNNASPTS